MRRKIADLLINSSHASLTGLIRKAEIVERHRQLFDTALPANLCGKVCFASLNDGMITALAPNAVVATQLKLQQHDILQNLQRYDEFRHSWQIKAKVRPTNTVAATRSTLPTISPSTAKLLREEALHCDDEDIAEALACLASHT